MIKCTDALPTWENIDDLIVVCLAEVDENLMPVPDGKKIITTAALNFGFHDNDKVYFDLVKVMGDGDFDFLGDTPEGSSDLYYTIKAGYRGWLTDRRKHTNFVIEAWMTLDMALEKMA